MGRGLTKVEKQC